MKLLIRTEADAGCCSHSLRPSLEGSDQQGAAALIQDKIPQSSRWLSSAGPGLQHGGCVFWGFDFPVRVYGPHLSEGNTNVRVVLGEGKGKIGGVVSSALCYVI